MRKSLLIICTSVALCFGTVSCGPDLTDCVTCTLPPRVDETEDKNDVGTSVEVNVIVNVTVEIPDEQPVNLVCCQAQKPVVDAGFPDQKKKCEKVCVKKKKVLRCDGKDYDNEKSCRHKNDCRKIYVCTNRVERCS